MGKIKFGVFLPFYAFQTKDPQQHFSLIREIVLECERLGYHTVWVDDHLMYNDWPILESWTTLSALSSITSKIRLGTMVSCNAHRNPALLAKAAATLDMLSNGRIEFGVGAGVQKTEHVAYGFGFSKTSVRIERLSEALEITRRLWTEEKASYKGKYYTIQNAVCEPKPIQKPHPPITVGGVSELLMEKVTAPYADRFDWGFLPSVEMYKLKLDVLKKHCTKIGRNFGKIEKSSWPGGQVLIAENQRELNEKIAKFKPENTSLEDFKKTTFAATPDECIERMKIYADLGVTHFMLFFGDLPRLDSLRQFSENVIAKMS
ncbi:MAG TPA: LLM class flavin-dependent oxidoreductase [Candidatus Acidoferrum sp.]|nr:LLM class flavin-dependent oxidoreductase [Candidatus Acidoferrum sp.]